MECGEREPRGLGPAVTSKWRCEGKGLPCGASPAHSAESWPVSVKRKPSPPASDLITAFPPTAGNLALGSRL